MSLKFENICLLCFSNGSVVRKGYGVSDSNYENSNGKLLDGQRKKMVFLR